MTDYFKLARETLEISAQRENETWREQKLRTSQIFALLAIHERLSDIAFRLEEIGRERK